jgi:hypothetical protein
LSRHIFPFRSSSGLGVTLCIFPWWHRTGVPTVHRLSIPAKAARRDDRLEFCQVEFSDGPQCLGCGGVAEPVGQGIEPGNEFGLQGEQLGDGIVPALWPGTPVGWPPIANLDDGRRMIGLVAGAVPGLSFGVAERGFTFGWRPLGMACSPLL